MTAVTRHHGETRPESDAVGDDPTSLADVAGAVEGRPPEQASAERRRALQQYIRALCDLSSAAPSRRQS
jgi:hypothetical protein